MSQGLPFGLPSPTLIYSQQSDTLENTAQGGGGMFITYPTGGGWVVIIGRTPSDPIWEPDIKYRGGRPEVLDTPL